MSEPMKPDNHSIGKKVFGPDDQELFACLSLDRNPLHMDAVAARRLITGHPVVHGIHILLTAIEYWNGDDNLPPVYVSCTFNNPVNVGETVSFFQEKRCASEYSVEASVNGVLCAQVILTTAQLEGDERVAAASVDIEPVTDASVVENLVSPLDMSPEHQLGKIYQVRLNSADFSASYPRSYRYFGKEGVAAVAALSYFVGMVCPGLHSIFSSLSFVLNEESDEYGALAFSILKYNDRYRSFDISFDGRIKGGIRAFRRMPPQPQPSFEEISALVAASEFRGTRSLVIGGSRGLGELAAKILAAGGGDVIVTYATGLGDAEKIRNEINQRGMGRCEILKFDLLSDVFDSLGVNDETLGAVYYFATPRIFRKRVGIFDSSLLQEFIEVYIDRFYALCASLEAGAAGGKIKVYFPSTVFVAERPKGMVEYAIAKAAAEVLIQEINKSFRKVSVLATRLPRLNTDQTSSLFKLPTDSNLEALIPVIRSMNK